MYSNLVKSDWFGKVLRLTDFFATYCIHTLAVWAMKWAFGVRKFTKSTFHCCLFTVIRTPVFIILCSREVYRIHPPCKILHLNLRTNPTKVSGKPRLISIPRPLFVKWWAWFTVRPNISCALSSTCNWAKWSHPIEPRTPVSGGVEVFLHAQPCPAATARRSWTGLQNQFKGHSWAPQCTWPRITIQAHLEATPRNVRLLCLSESVALAA